MYTRLLHVGPIYFSCLPWKHILSFTCLRLCSCCSLHQDLHSLHLAPGKLACLCKKMLSFLQEPLTPLCPCLILHDTVVAHAIAVTCSHLAAFVLAVPNAHCPKCSSLDNHAVTSVPSPGPFAKSTFLARSSLAPQKCNDSQSSPLALGLLSFLSAACIIIEQSMYATHLFDLSHLVFVSLTLMESFLPFYSIFTIHNPRHTINVQ